MDITGSYTSSSKPFIEVVNPSYAVVSCAKNNNYGHPCKSTMDLMKKMNINIYRTDESSNIVLTSDGNDITFNVKNGTYSFISAK